jgi:hypothetical protein
MVLNAAETVIESGGDVYFAPVGTAFPLAFAAPTAPWLSVGHMSTDGPRPSGFDADSDKFYSWQSPRNPIRTAAGQAEPTFTCDLYQVNSDVLGLYFGPGSVVGGVFTPTVNAISAEAAIVIDTFDGTRQYRWCVKRTQPSAAGEINLTSSELAVFPVRFDMLVPADNSAPFEFRMPLPAATGATAGTPGTWTPASSQPPASVAALIAGTPNTVTASPATAWTTGQYVQTATAGVPGQAHWSGTAWVAGAA